MDNEITPVDIIDYWYSDRIKKHWFNSTVAVDKEILDKYEIIWEKALSGDLDNWADKPEGCLALAILLDQFPLNMFRGKVKSFSSEHKAVEITYKAVKNKFHYQLKTEKLVFLYMPLMHSENIMDQDISVKLFGESNLDANIRFAEHHREMGILLF